MALLVTVYQLSLLQPNNFLAAMFMYAAAVSDNHTFCGGLPMDGSKFWLAMVVVILTKTFC